VILQVVLCGLAGWRLSSFFTQESGPANIFGWVRTKVGATPDDTIREGSLGELFSCDWCMSVWMTGAAWACWQWLAVWPVAIMAAATVAILCDETARRVRG
jgi:hypothetical protein